MGFVSKVSKLKFCLKFLISELIPALHTFRAEWMPVSYDARNKEIYREMTVCSRVKITRFHHNEQLAAHIFLMEDTDTWEKDRWYIAIYQPISGLSDMGRQVFQGDHKKLRKLPKSNSNMS